MYTQTHVLLGAALLGGRLPRKAWIAALGGLVPDIPELIAYAVAKAVALPGAVMMGLLYTQQWWRITEAVAHNFWAWGGLLLIATALRERLSATVRAIDAWSLVAVFAGAGLLHSVIDFLCQREDAHMSLWPVSNWTHTSPVSYWDPAHYGRIFSVLEIVLGLALAALLWRRFTGTWLRLALICAVALYALRASSLLT